MIKRMFIAALAFAGGVCLACGAEAADRLRIAIQKTGTASWEIALIKARGLDKAADLDIETTELASTEAGKVALEGGAADMVVGDWLWVGARARARRQAPVHALFERARRGDGAEGFAGPYARRSRRPVDRRRRRTDRQELAPVAGGGARRWARPHKGRAAVLRRAAAHRGEARPGRDRDRARILEFLRRSRGARLPPRDRNGRCREGARRERPGGDDRLCVQRILRRLAQGRAQALFRRGGRGAQDPGAKIRAPGRRSRRGSA